MSKIAVNTSYEQSNAGLWCQDISSNINISSHCETTFRAKLCKFRPNNGNKLPTCPTLSNGCMSHPDRWMDLFSQELLLQVYIRRGWFGPIADSDADTTTRLYLGQFGTSAWNKMNNPNYVDMLVSLKLEAVKTWQVLSKQPFEWSP